jgi:outer membrane protein assembly factor BamB
MMPYGQAASARADEVTGSVNNLRDGWDSNEPGLSPSVVSGGSFGELFSTRVNGQVYAQPLVVGLTVIVATENDWVYGIDAATGHVKWARHLGTPWPSASVSCPDVRPKVGITGTPVYDPQTRAVYLIAETIPAGATKFQPVMNLVGLAVATGRIVEKVLIHGAPVNAPTRPFDTLSELQRPALLLMNGWVYAAFGSHCDFTPYVGYVAGIDLATRYLTLWTDEAGVTDTMAGIWQSGGGLVSDASGQILFASGNGVSPAPGPGQFSPSNPPQTALAESVVRLGVQAGGTLAAEDFFSPANAPVLDAADTDLGSGGPVGLPVGTAADPELLVQAGKDGRVFLLNRANLGGRQQGPGQTDDVLAEAGPFGGQWGHPAVFEASTSPLPASASGMDDYIYYAGVSDYLRALRLGSNAADAPTLTAVAQNSTIACMLCAGSPVVTSNGTDPASAVVWEITMSHWSGADGTLTAYAAVPQGGTLQTLWSAPIGLATKFSSPATSNGRVYVGTKDGHLIAFGSPSSAPITGATPAAFGQVRIGHAVTMTITATAATTVTLTRSSTIASLTPNPFHAGQVLVNGRPATLPVTLTDGDSVAVPVRFTPTAPGGASGALRLSTTTANFPSVDISLRGAGIRPGFYTTPGVLQFGRVPDGMTVGQQVDLINSGSRAERVTATTLPHGPFRVTGLPRVGQVVKAGQAVVVSVSYTPRRTALSHAVVRVSGPVGRAAVVPISGTGIAGRSRFVVSRASVNFGNVPVGVQATRTVTVTNAGNLPATIVASTPPAVPFGMPATVQRGQPLNPGYSITVPITFTPSGVGAVTGQYRLAWTDARGRHTAGFGVRGEGVPPRAGNSAVEPPGGGWSFNGSAQMSGTSLRVTAARRHQAGSAVYGTPVASQGLTARFSVRLGGGTGGDGITFALLNPRTSTPSALGGRGTALGFGGLKGVAVVLGTFQGPGDPSGNFLGIATGTSGGHLVFTATTTSVPDLRSGTHTVQVRVRHGRLSVFLDGTRFLARHLPLPPEVRLAFTGGTGTRDDRQFVSGPIITASGSSVPAPGGGWSYNAAAHAAGPATALTGTAPGAAGSVIYPVPVATDGLRVTFDAALYGGTGGDGLTFALLDPASATARSVGGPGADLGFGGLNGVAVALATHHEPGFPAGNFVGLSAGTGGGSGLAFQQSSTLIAPLRDGIQRITVAVRSGVVIVWLNGAQVLQLTEPSLPASALLAFTGATGTVTDIHAIGPVAITAQP